MSISKRDKYVVDNKGLNFMFLIGSNHPRRIGMLCQKNYKERLVTPEILNPWRISHISNSMNVVIGDSHSEFTTRYYKSLFKNGNSSPKNLSLAMTTGATTLIGALRSRYYFNNIIRSLVMVNESIRETDLKVDRINIVVSLGEIDIRTKIYLEALKTNTNLKEVLDFHLDNILEEKIIEFYRNLNYIFKEYKICLYYKIPTPPSRDDFFTPKKYDDAMNIIKVKSFPRLGSLEDRINIYKYMIEKINHIFAELPVEILTNPQYYINHCLESSQTHDGCHISIGEWAEFNSRQLIWL